MDPVSALGLAASVVQCVQFTSSLIKGTHAIYSSSQGFSAQSQELEHIYRQLSGFSSDLAKQSRVSSQSGTKISTYEAPLKELAQSCREACDEILLVVAKLRAGNSTQRLWESFKKALNERLKHDDLQRLQEKIKRIESLMVLHMSAISIENTGRLLTEVHDLIDQSQKLHCSHGTDLQRIQTDISKILRELDCWRGQHGSHGSDGIDIRFLTTKLSELSLESRKIRIAQGILATLDYSQRPLRHANIPEAHERTYSWALKEDDTEEAVRSRRGQGNLSRWLYSGHGMFWVSGKPGSGKSTFMKYVTDHPKTRRALSNWASPHEIIIVSHYFWKPGTQIQRSSQGLWQSLLLEILSKDTDAIPEVCKERWQQKVAHPEHPSIQNPWGISELRNSFSRLAQRQSTRFRICVFIDGLDEFDGDHLDISQALSELSCSPMVKVCVSSRPWNVFETSLGQSPFSKIYMHELTRDDVLRYSESQLAQHPRWATAVSSVDAERFIKDITDRAQGVFLWVCLVTKLLREGLTNDDTSNDLRRVLDSIHPDLEQFFKQILDGVSRMYHEKMAGFLEFSLAARSPLDAYIYHFHELEYGDAAFALKEGISPHDTKDVENIRSRVRCRLDAICKGLLEVDNEGKVQYIHRTVKDWLDTADMRRYLKTKAKADSNTRLSILRAYLAWYKHPMVGSEIEIPEDEASSLITMSPFEKQLMDALTLARRTEDLGEAHIINEVCEILDNYLSAGVEMFKAGLIKFVRNHRNAWPKRSGRVGEAGDLMLRSMIAHQGPYHYLARKAREHPNYFTPLVESDDSLYDTLPYEAVKEWKCFQDGELEPLDLVEPLTHPQMDSTQREVATCILKLLIVEYIPADIVNAASKPLDDNVRWRVERVMYLIQDFLLVADINVIVWTTGDSLPIPAWMVIILLTPKIDWDRMSEEMRDTLASKSLMDKINPDVLASCSETGRTPWDILCSHISALRGNSRTIDMAPREGLVTENDAQLRAKKADGKLLEFVSHVLGILADKLVTCCDDHYIPWGKLMAAITKGLPPHRAERFSTRLKGLGLLPEDEDPESGPAGDVQIANVVGPAAPQSSCPGELRKWSLAEMLPCWPM